MKSERELGYILVKPMLRQLYTINLIDKQLIDLSKKVRQAPALPEVSEINIDYTYQGPGPKLLGYQTETYQLKANDTICLTEYLTTSEPELSNLLPSLDLMTEYKISTSFSTLPRELDICFVANNITYKRHTTHGFPLKSIDQIDKTQFEVIHIDKKAKGPINNFGFPENYTVLTYDQMMNSATNFVTDSVSEMHPEPIAQDLYFD